MTSVTPMRLKRRTDVVTDGDQQEKILKTPPTPARAFRGSEGGGIMTELNKLTIAAARDALKAGT